MTLEGEQTLLRVDLRNTDRHGWFSPPAAEELVRGAVGRHGRGHRAARD